MGWLLYAPSLQQNKKRTQAFSCPREARRGYLFELARKLGRQVFRDSLRAMPGARGIAKPDKVGSNETGKFNG
jgi:hypothetical protein